MKKIIILILAFILLPIKLVKAIDYECVYQYNTAVQTGAKKIFIRFNDSTFSVKCGNEQMNANSKCEIPLTDGSGTLLIEGYNISIDSLLNEYKYNMTRCPEALHVNRKNIMSLNDGSKYIFNYFSSQDYSSNGSSVGETSTDGDLGHEVPNLNDCNNDLLGDPDTTGTPAFYLVKSFHVIKYVALVLLIVLSVMDFSGAVASQDADAIKKVTKKLVQRFILCIIIFMLPYIINLLLKYLVERKTSLCGIGG